MREIVFAVVQLLAGFVLLIKGADFFVEGSSSVAKRLRVPSIIIGMTIVAMGTSLPECAVSVTASLNNNNSLAISNAIGSNIFNLMVVCGACALFAPLTVHAGVLKREFPFSVLCAILLLALGSLGMELGHLDGAVLIVLFCAYLLYMVLSAKKARTVQQPDDKDYKVLAAWKCVIFIIGGAAAIVFGGDFVVDGATVIALRFGLSQTLVGLTVVALGTSLPELVTSIVAARKNEVDMALGNVIGSNIFNILMVLGIAGAISPLDFLMENFIDIGLLILMSVIVWIFAWTRKKVAKGEGIVMLLLYAAYMVYICVRK